MTLGSIQFIQVIVSALVALFVTTLTHLFTSHRDRESKRREQRLSYLVSAYRVLGKANHHPRLHEIGEELQGAVHDIQLFGTSAQIRLAQQFARDLSTPQGASMDELFFALRDNIRAELRAEPIPQEELSGSALRRTKSTTTLRYDEGSRKVGRCRRITYRSSFVVFPAYVRSRCKILACPPLPAVA